MWWRLWRWAAAVDRRERLDRGDKQPAPWPRVSRRPPVRILREIVAGRDQRNAKVAAIVTLLAAANILFHAEVFVFGMTDYALRAGIAAAVGLVILIGGRIVPSFMRNWLAKRGSAVLPTPFGRFDMVALGVTGTAFFPLGRSAGGNGHGRRAPRGGGASCDSHVALDRRAHLARAVGPHTSYRLCFRADWLLSGRTAASRYTAPTPIATAARRRKAARCRNTPPNGPGREPPSRNPRARASDANDRPDVRSRTRLPPTSRAGKPAANCV